MRNFVKLLGSNKAEYFGVVAASSVLMGGEAVIQPLLMKAIFDGVTEQRAFNDFIPLGLGYLALGVTVNVLSFAIFNWRIRSDNNIVLSVSTRLLERYYFISYGELLSKGTGHYVSRIRLDVKEGLVPMLAAVRDLTVGIVSFVMLISVLIYISLPAFLILAAMIPVFAAVSIMVSKRIKALTQTERDLEATILDVLTRSVAAFKMVTTFSLISNTVQTAVRTIDEGLTWSLKRSRMVRILQMAGDLTRVASDVSSVFVGAFLVISGKMTVGSFIAFMNAFWRSSSTLFLVLNKWAETHSYASTIDRLVAFERQPPPVPHQSSTDRVSLTDVGFSYAETPVISGFSLNIEPGERVLIVGENGSGKTTLANILSGLLHPGEGQLSLPKTVSSATLPTHFPPVDVGSLGIDPRLLAKLGFADREMMSTRPDFLSAGQQQKLVVALAISHEAELYVLDEPFANLSIGSREMILEEILRCTAGSILVVVAHDTGGYAHHFSRVVEVGGETAYPAIRAQA